MIIYEHGKPRYFDKRGREITDGCTIRYEDGRTEKAYRTTDDQLGSDATNPHWIQSGRVIPCEYGVCPLDHDETNVVEVIAERNDNDQE